MLHTLTYTSKLTVRGTSKNETLRQKISYTRSFNFPIISLSWYDIPELVVPIRIYLIEDYCSANKEATEPRVPIYILDLSWSHHFGSFMSPPWFGWQLWNICVTNDHVYQGRIQDFKIGAHLKKCAERREARKFLGYFVWKITILRQKIIFFPILGVRPCICFTCRKLFPTLSPFMTYHWVCN